MAWTLLEDTPAPMLRWQVRLTAAEPDSGPQSLALIESATAHIEGVFGAATVDVRGSNSGRDYIPFDAVQHREVVAVLPMLYLKVVAHDADETTDVLVTLVGRR